MLITILLSLQILVALIMGGLILLQRSEGGALGIGGGPSGLVSARGAGNLLTRSTAILAFIFFANSIGLTVAFALEQKSQSAINQVDTSKLILPKTQTQAPQTPPQPQDTLPTNRPSLTDLPLSTAAPTATLSPPVVTSQSASKAAPAASSSSSKLSASVSKSATSAKPVPAKPSQSDAPASATP